MSLAKNVEFLRHFPKLNGFNGLGIYGRTDPQAGHSPLVEISEFGTNPGALKMFAFVPEPLPRAPALVVVLHGCGQTAAAYDFGTGWSTLAKRYGFALLMPEQQGSNNANTCFNWFNPGDVARGRGEAASIRQMVARMVADHKIDPGRIYITGLSAGGAMTSVMLAVYPEVFAGGAIIAGLPYGIASNVREALGGMMQSTSRPADQLGDLVRKASKHKGPWPKVSVWHGSADRTVNPGNANEIVKQWLDVHGLPAAPMSTGDVDGHPRDVWWNADGETVVESYTIIRHGPWHAAGPGRQRRTLWRGRRVPDRGGNFVVLSHRKLFRPHRPRQSCRRSCQTGAGIEHRSLRGHEIPAVVRYRRHALVENPQAGSRTQAGAARTEARASMSAPSSPAP